MMYYVMKEMSRIATNTEVRVTYDPSKSLMVCDDLVAANKYFEYCVSKKSGRFTLFADSVTHPCRLSGLSALTNKGKVLSGNSGFQEIRGCSLYRNQQSGRYDIVEVGARWLVTDRADERIVRINMFDFYKNMPCTLGYRVEGQIMTHHGPHGTEKRIYKLRYGIKGVMKPFDVCYKVDPA